MSLRFVDGATLRACFGHRSVLRCGRFLASTSRGRKKFTTARKRGNSFCGVVTNRATSNVNVKEGYRFSGICSAIKLRLEAMRGCEATAAEYAQPPRSRAGHALRSGSHWATVARKKLSKP